MKRRCTLPLLAAGLLAALTVTAGAQFKDLDGCWARDYINKLASMGYLTGYSDGTVRPDNSVSTCEALVMLARFYPLSKDMEDLVHQDYGAFISSNIDPTLNWAFDELETCLAAGILSEKELKDIRLTSPISKETLAILLVRAMQLTKEAATANPDSLTFTDAADITRDFRGHIVVLVNAGIISGDNNRFLPRSSVNRAVVSAMLVRALDYNTAKGRSLTLDNYSGILQYSGMVSNVEGTVLTLRDTSSLERVFDIPSSVELTLNDTAVHISDALRGKHAVVRVRDKTVMGVSVDDRKTWVQGRLVGVSRESAGYALQVRIPDSDTVERYLISASGVVSVDSETRDPAALKENMYITLTVDGRNVTSAVAYTGSFNISGTISALAYGAPVQMEVSGSDGGRFRFSLDLTDLPTITRGGTSVGVERLSVGDSVTLGIHNCQLDRIDATSNETILDGVIKSIVSDEQAGMTLIIQDDMEGSHSLIVDPAATVYQGSKAILVNEIQVGDSVSVSTNGHSIKEIRLKSTSANNAGKLTGTVLSYDAGTKELTVTNTAGRWVYVSLKESGFVLDADTGEKIAVHKLRPNDPIVAYGSYTDANKFQAASIVLEG